MMEQTEAMKGFTELAMWSFLQPGNGQKADIGLLKEAVHELCQMTMLLMMCLISENVGNKLDIIAVFLFIYAMNPDEE